MATPHIKAEPSDFAKTVLMPGDPLRSKFIAQTFLDSVRLVNNVRGVQGYTGTWRGVPISVMASGMGMPSMGIYSHELFNFYGVENIIRVGSAGAFSEKIKLGDLVIGIAASTTSSYPDNFLQGVRFSPTADFDLISLAVGAAEAVGARYHVGGILSTDMFYNPINGFNEACRDMGILAVEMEAAALYTEAAAAGKRALAICTVSDHVITGEALNSDSREIGFTDMIKVALNVAAGLG